MRRLLALLRKLDTKIQARLIAMRQVRGPHVPQEAAPSYQIGDLKSPRELLAAARMIDLATYYQYEPVRPNLMYTIANITYNTGKKIAKKGYIFAKRIKTGL